MTDRHFVNLFILHIFPLSQVEHTFCFALSVFFYAQFLLFGAKNHMICIFAAIMICVLLSDHAVDKMSVGRANENLIYILCYIMFENY